MSTLLKSLMGAILLVSLGCGQEVKIVQVDPANFRFTKTTQSQKLVAKGQDIRGADIPGVGFTYRSENPSVASVDSSGLVKPTGNGSTAIIAEATNGVQGEGFVKVCLPKALNCEPADLLDIKVGIAAPIKCHVTNCKDEIIPAKIELTPTNPQIVLKEGDNVFIGLAVGDTDVTVKAFTMEKKVKIHVDEQTYAPGMGPGSAPKRRGGGGGDKSSDPYGGGGRYDHIIKNMKFDK